jgi:hypothetical protein
VIRRSHTICQRRQGVRDDWRTPRWLRDATAQCQAHGPLRRQC